MGVHLLIAALATMAWAQEPEETGPASDEAGEETPESADSESRECEDAPSLVRRAERDVEGYYLAEAAAEIAQAKAGLGCGPILDTAMLARMWQVEGVVLTLQDDPAGGQRSFAASGRLSPDTWNANYGADMRQKFDDATASAPTAEGQIKVRSVTKIAEVAIDGQIVEMPIKATAGLHLVQVMDETTLARFARIVDLPAKEQLVLTVPVRRVGDEEWMPPPDSSLIMTYRGHPSRDLIIGSGVTAVATIASLAVAGVANEQFLNTPTEYEAKKHMTVNRATFLSGIAAGAATGGLIIGAVVQGKW
ncbi:MAG: hypothetical protein HN348_11350, partial [Proteobacteria bacterium]|nr:hypothetical protein [Pseudomonadota bacterium]